MITTFSTLTRSACGMALCSILTVSSGAVTLNFSQSGDFGDLDSTSPTASAVVVDGATSVKITISATALRGNPAGPVSNTYTLNNNTSHIGVNSSGGDNGLAFENDPAGTSNSTYTETLILTFTDLADNPLAVSVSEFGVGNFAAGEGATFNSGLNNASFVGSNSYDSTNPFLPFTVSDGVLNIGAVSGSDLGLANLTFTVVPEPASLMLIGAGLALMAGRRRRALAK